MRPYGTALIEYRVCILHAIVTDGALTSGVNFDKSTDMQLLDLPEEILVLILELSIRPIDPRVSLPNAQCLLTCPTFHRIGLPILYRTLVLKSSSNAECLRLSLLERPTLVHHVRHLYSRVTTFWLQLVLRAIGHAKGSLHTLDFSISAIWVSGRIDSRDEGEPLAVVPVRRLAVRSGSGWVMHDRVLSIVNSLAEAIERWPNLVRSFHPRPFPFPFIDIEEIGGCGYRTSPATFVHTAGTAVSRRAGVVPLAYIAVFTDEPSTEVGSLFAHRERESQPKAHCSHDHPGVLRVRWYQLQVRGGACGIFSRTDKCSSVARGGTETSPIDGTYRRVVRIRLLWNIYSATHWLINLSARPTSHDDDPFDTER